MIGRSTSSKPAPSISATKRDSILRRRAVSSTSSGLTPVGYRNFVAIKQKPPSPSQRRGSIRSSGFVLSSERPFVRGASRRAPLHHVVMVVVPSGDESNVHWRCSVRERAGRRKDSI